MKDRTLDIINDELIGKRKEALDVLEKLRQLECEVKGLEAEIENYDVKFPAVILAVWGDKRVYCCKEHYDGLVKVGGVMGLHVPAYPLNYGDKRECLNCVNEAKGVEA